MRHQYKWLVVATLTVCFTGIANAQYFESLYAHRPEKGVLDGTRKWFLINVYSTSKHWPHKMQQSLDRHAGSDSLYYIYLGSFQKGGTPISKWTDICGDWTKMKIALAQVSQSRTAVPSGAMYCAALRCRS